MYSKKSLLLKQKPCLVHYLDEVDQFLVGTYQLITSVEEARSSFHNKLTDSDIQAQLKRLNNRLGKLILININKSSLEPKIEVEHCCELGGGVFDFKVLKNASNTIYVAHSNGHIGIYQLDINPAPTISLLKVIEISNVSLLTCIDTFSHTCQVVGDSDGSITIINNESNYRARPSLNGFSIWQVKTINSTLMDIIIVASEDSNWYIYSFWGDKLELIYKNCDDFISGVTCISTIRTSDKDSVRLFIGSYDETLRAYSIEFKDGNESKPHVSCQHTTVISDGGIWRVKRIAKYPNKFLVAAMYAGAYILTLENEVPNKDRLASIVDVDKIALYYDADVSHDDICCIVDFNNSKCIFGRLCFKVE